MILAGTRPPSYAELRDRARRADEVAAENDEDAREVEATQASEPVRSAVDIAPRPPSD
jgi:hypothetical protein